MCIRKIVRTIVRKCHSRGKPKARSVSTLPAILIDSKAKANERAKKMKNGRTVKLNEKADARWLIKNAKQYEILQRMFLKTDTEHNNLDGSLSERFLFFPY